MNRRTEPATVFSMPMSAYMQVFVLLGQLHREKCLEPDLPGFANFVAAWPAIGRLNRKTQNTVSSKFDGESNPGRILEKALLLRQLRSIP
jgi:hypothetical protein